MNEENKEENSAEEKSDKLAKSRENVTNKLRANPFILSTIVCGVLVLILLVVVISGGASGGISANAVKDNVFDFASSQLGDMEILGIEKQNGLYKILFTSSKTGES